jgi:hypothetical protein
VDARPAPIRIRLISVLRAKAAGALTNGAAVVFLPRRRMPRSPRVATLSAEVLESTSRAAPGRRMNTIMRKITTAAGKTSE